MPASLLIHTAFFSPTFLNCFDEENQFNLLKKKKKKNNLFQTIFFFNIHLEAEA